MINLEHAELFLAVAQAGSLAEAAERAFLAKSTVKKSMDALEQQVGTPLLDRSTRGVVLTAAGEVFVDYARSLLQMEKDAVAECRRAAERDTSRVVRVAYYSDIIFPIIQSCVDHYVRIYPADRVEPVFAPFAGAYDGIRNGLFDVAFCPRPRPLDAVGLASVVTFRTPMIGLVSSSGVLAAKEALSRRDLAEHTTAIHTPWYHQEEIAVWSKRAVPVFDVIPMDGGMGAIQEVCSKDGIFLFPRSDASQYPYRSVPLTDELVMTGSLTYSSAPTLAVLDFVRETEAYIRSVTDPQTLMPLVDLSALPLAR